MHNIFIRERNLRRNASDIAVPPVNYLWILWNIIVAMASSQTAVYISHVYWRTLCLPPLFSHYTGTPAISFFRFDVPAASFSVHGARNALL